MHKVPFETESCLLSKHGCIFLNDGRLYVTNCNTFDFLNDNTHFFNLFWVFLHQTRKGMLCAPNYRIKMVSTFKKMDAFYKVVVVYILQILITLFMQMMTPSFETFLSFLDQTSTDKVYELFFKLHRIIKYNMLEIRP